jgi:hypothetical protein
VTRRFRPLRVLGVAGLVAGIAIGIPILVRHLHTERSGSALDEGGGGGAGGPVVAGAPLSFGLLTTRNVSHDPVQLVSARLLWLDPGLKLLGFSAHSRNGTGGVPITAREWPVANGVALQNFPPLAADAHEDQVTIVFGLTVEPGREGKALGVVVRYRQNGKVKEQLFKEQAFVCAVPVVEPNVSCPGHARDFDVAKNFDEELKARRSKGGSPAG